MYTRWDMKENSQLNLFTKKINFALFYTLIYRMPLTELNKCNECQ